MEKMTILSVLKKIKHIDRKIDKNKVRLAKWCSYFNIELGPDEHPPYDADKLIQALDDQFKYRAILRHALHKANIENKVEYKGEEKTIDELLILRTKTLSAKLECLKLLRRKEKGYKTLSHLTDDERKAVVVINQFDSLKRDRAIDKIENQQAELDEILDEVNITLSTNVSK